MLVITDKDRQKRQEQLDKPEIDRLMKKATKGSMETIILQSKYGLDLDYDPKNWGNPPQGE